MELPYFKYFLCGTSHIPGRSSTSTSSALCEKSNVAAAAACVRNLALGTMGFFGMRLEPGEKEAVEVPPGWRLQLCTAALEPAKNGSKVKRSDEQSE